MDTMGMESMGSMNMENLTAMMEDKENMSGVDQDDIGESNV